MKEWPSDWRVCSGHEGPYVMSHSLMEKGPHRYVPVLATTPEDVAEVLTAYGPLVDALKKALDLYSLGKEVASRVAEGRDDWKGKADEAAPIIDEARALLKLLDEGA